MGIHLSAQINASLFFIAVSDFITAPNFGIVINKMRFSGKRKACCKDEEWLSEKYTTQMLEPKYKDNVIKYELRYVMNRYDCYE